MISKEQKEKIADAMIEQFKLASGDPEALARQGWRQHEKWVEHALHSVGTRSVERVCEHAPADGILVRDIIRVAGLPLECVIETSLIGLKLRTRREFRKCT